MTGALETGAKFRAAGILAVVAAKPIPSHSAPAIVLDTETRHCSPDAAIERVSRFVAESRQTLPRLIYKKTDSTLRGNIAAELRALAGLFPEWRIGYAPAYPALGRTVRNGALLVDGVPVSETAFSKDLLNPVRDSSVAAILGPGLDCLIFDGATDGDVDAAARAILSDPAMRIAAGPAALAGAIADRIDAPREAPAPLPSVRTCLLINGSRHEISARQMERVEQRRRASPDPGAPWRILRATLGPLDPAEVARENGRRAVERIAADDPDAVLVIGGDTAFAVVSALGLPVIVPVGEVVPGVPVSRIEAPQIRATGRTRDLILITKAGGFGSPETLCQVRDRLDEAK
jgi:uncharacterized protein YgbK (DUF1537 family)